MRVARWSPTLVPRVYTYLFDKDMLTTFELKAVDKFLTLARCVQLGEHGPFFFFLSKVDAARLAGHK